ncbi:PxKF domain-containing protein [Actinomadura roseirufa]|uniref:PxKF domain-containing protein n=1 Tax=Actinomadura roseirufa TaxID=2094049 RepID=UPI0013F1457F|nr:PxKF domain-containing protein [Actinomadura roseirufa]
MAASVMLGAAGLAAVATPALADTATFSYTGAAQTFTVPAGVTSITVDASGAQGSAGEEGGGAGGLGGQAQATLTVTPGQVLQVNVGGSGGFGGGGAGGPAAPGAGGGSGGGATDIRTGSFGLADRILVAGGGGGGGNCFCNVPQPGIGGAGGGASGADGTAGVPQGGSPGGGGTATTGGAGGTGSAGGGSGTAGASGTGGAGGSTPNIIPGTGGGGGGGGWFGGGGGGGQGAGGPGISNSAGGSGHGPAGTTLTAGVRSGDGAVTITYTSGPSYTFTGFFAPVDNPPVINTVNAGRSIPIKFSLGGDQGLNILADGSPYSQATTCGTGTQDPIETTTDSNSGLTYNPSTGQYTYVWKTDKDWAGTCRTLHLKLTDGTDHTANFQFN